MTRGHLHVLRLSLNACLASRPTFVSTETKPPQKVSVRFIPCPRPATHQCSTYEVHGYVPQAVGVSRTALHTLPHESRTVSLSPRGVEGVKRPGQVSRSPA